MKLFFKMKPLLRSAQAEEELAALRAELRGLRGALAAAEAKRQELEETHVSVTQEKNDLALQLQAVSETRARTFKWLMETLTRCGQGSLEGSGHCDLLRCLPTLEVPGDEACRLSVCPPFPVGLAWMAAPG